VISFLNIFLIVNIVRRFKNEKVLNSSFIGVIFILSFKDGYNYPPAVGILGKSKSCTSCHINNGLWSDEDKTIIDILDKETGKSLLAA
jgi:hypothetical protein